MDVYSLTRKKRPSHLTLGQSSRTESDNDSGLDVSVSSTKPKLGSNSSFTFDQVTGSPTREHWKVNHSVSHHVKCNDLPLCNRETLIPLHANTLGVWPSLDCLKEDITVGNVETSFARFIARITLDWISTLSFIQRGYYQGDVINVHSIISSGKTKCGEVGILRKGNQSINLHPENDRIAILWRQNHRQWRESLNWEETVSCVLGPWWWMMFFILKHLYRHCCTTKIDAVVERGDYKHQKG